MPGQSIPDEQTSQEGRKTGDVGPGRARIASVYFRSLSEPGPHDSKRELLASVGRLEQLGVVDDHEVRLLGKKLCTCEQCAKTEPIRSRLAEIERWKAWADSAGATLFLDEHAVDSELTGERYRYVVPPTATLVVRVGERIEGIFPNRFDGTLYTPQDYLSAALEGDVEMVAGTVDAE